MVDISVSSLPDDFVTTASPWCSYGFFFPPPPWKCSSNDISQLLEVHTIALINHWPAPPTDDLN